MAASLTQFSTAACLTTKKSFNLIKICCVFPLALNAESPFICNHQVTNPKTPLSLTRNNLQPARVSRREKWTVLGIDDGSCGVAPDAVPPSVLESVEDFYKAINTRDIETLEQLVADDCQYQDLIFYAPFEGKQAIKQFLTKLMGAMEPNVHFVIDGATEGGNLTASVIWHLEWKEKEIPFTRGYTYFEYEQVEGQLLLRKATGMEESPIKLGDLVLKLLKSASTFFDLYPMAAEVLLKSHGSGPNEALDTLLGKPSDGH